MEHKMECGPARDADMDHARTHECPMHAPLQIVEVDNPGDRDPPITLANVEHELGSKYGGKLPKKLRTKVETKSRNERKTCSRENWEV